MSSPSAAARAIQALVSAYQVLLGPLMGGACRYTPSCSEYMSQAVARHGAVRGGWLGLRRVARCHPFGGHGWDPVPENAEGRMQNVEGTDGSSGPAAFFRPPSGSFISHSTLRRRCPDHRESRAVVR